MNIIQSFNDECDNDYPFNPLRTSMGSINEINSQPTHCSTQFMGPKIRKKFLIRPKTVQKSMFDTPKAYGRSLIDKYIKRQPL